ncbi:hypothetical protein Sme01_33800 [Sphaerisporangium melleum]|uniref:DUF4407 domain-containing protein n=1 Tax=Sphaerisporangium melleum TaxID=321316 RepID=A0A917QXK1_9ACTN|nr:DUF4407 domain-containing protein [Sphaerisporangium melleum]GGK74351.1 hypothetical protein GCM10007964_16470 [Sphaerisporangium melleum]GII70904.1 hypothetical protein Sme01_33800 [Sphaerisporangium melleum]
MVDILHGSKAAEQYGRNPRRRRKLGLGMLLRRFTGVDEKILASVPQERSRYTSLGGVVVSTALIAGASMLGALTLLSQASPLYLLPVAVLWGLIIANVDRFLITSLHGDNDGWSRWGNVLIRLALAVVIGVFIAEPLTLKIFQERLDRQILVERDQAISLTESRYKQCNPLNGPAPSGVDCTSYRLDGGDQALAVEGNMTQRQGSLDAAEARLAADIAEHGRLEKLRDQECYGKDTDQTTGIPGDGPECKIRKNALNTFLANHDIPQQQADVAKLRTQLGLLAADRAGAEKERAATLSKKIAEHVEEKKRAYTDIGLLDRWEALGTVAGQNGMVNFAHWLLRIIFVLLDCMPIISKMLNGKTEYDRLLAQELRAGSACHEAELNFTTRQTTGEYEIRLREEERRLKAERGRIDRDQRVDEASRDDEIDRLARTFMAAMPTQR